ncbi:putative ribonuclease H-like domain-containing protein [Tanacetum coccineum]
MLSHGVRVKLSSSPTSSITFLIYSCIDITDSSPPSRVSAILRSLAGLGGGGFLKEYVRVVAETEDVANNEIECSPSEVCLSDSDSELLIPTPWSDESKNEKGQKGINDIDLEKGTEVMKDKIIQKHVCEKEVHLNNNIGKQSGDLVEMPSEAVKRGKDDHVPDEINGATGEEVANHGGDELVDKERILKRKRVIFGCASKEDLEEDGVKKMRKSLLSRSLQSFKDLNRGLCTRDFIGFRRVVLANDSRVLAAPTTQLSLVQLALIPTAMFLKNVLHSFVAELKNLKRGCWGHFARECTGKEVDSKTRYMGDDIVIPAVDVADGVSTDGIFADGVFVATGNGSDGVYVAAGVGADGVSVTSSDATDAETQFALMGSNLEESEASLANGWILHNLNKLINWLHVLRSKFGLGYGDTFRSDEVFDLSAPSIFDSCLKDALEKPLYDRFIKAVGLHAVPGPITGTFMPPSNKPDIDDTQYTYGSKSNNCVETNSVSNDFVSCDNSDKSSDSETTGFASCVSSVKSSSLKTKDQLASASSSVDLKLYTRLIDKDHAMSLKLRLNNAPMWKNVENIPSFVPRPAYVPAGSRNRPTSVPAGRPFPAGSRNRPTSVPAGRPFPAGWHNPAARPMTRPKSHYFQQFSGPGSYNQMDMDGGRWGTADNPHTNKDLGIVDSGCSRSMTGNKGKLADFVKIKGGTVTFGGGDGKITGKGTIRTSNFNFENVYYVEELQNFNLFSVSQICDTKHKVLFTEKECLVLSKEFQLPDSSQVVLRVPRRHNLYCFNLTDIHSEREIQCLLAKASLDESIRWHRRMAHGKQHKASYKAITAVSTIFEPLQLLHIDLFGPTSIRSIDHKSYSLVVTDDFSRFSWVFFLGTKDETFYILRDFITFVENQLTKKVKAIRCDNGTEFKNSHLIELCGSKGIKRDYSVARTPQQNGVAERKNRTLIEAARTMLADSKLPTMFWSEAVSTACYVLNRVLVTRPHNKTPYELLSGKVPNVSHLKPFGCHVTILNTSDHLGKFEGKADEGFLVGYSAHSKAYRVYNLSNKKIEETLNLRYMEDKPNVQGLGHEWYFDLDYLTDSLGYTRFKSNQPAGTQDTNTHAGTNDDSDSECDEQVIVVPSFPSNHFSGPKVHTASATVESTSDYAEELARLQGQAYEANSAAKDTWKTADTVPAGSGVPATSIPAGSINQAAGGSAVPSTPSSSVVEPVHADDTPLPPGHSLGSSENSTRFSSPSDLANHISSSSEMEGIHHHPTTGIFSESTYDADFGGSVTNLAPTIAVDPVPTRRVHTVHPISQIIGDITSPVLTRGTLKKSKFGESALAGYVHDQQRNNHTDYLHCLFACFLSQLEPSSVAQALNDPDWVEAMQEEMQQFVNQDVWKLVPLPEGKTAIGTKWILKNKRDARGIVVRNKARLVAQGHRQEEGIDYDEVFAPVARIEAIRLFLAFASYMGFMVYQMDVKSAFLYGEIDEEVYVTQPKGFEDPFYPKHVYRVVKALYGLHQAPRAWYARLSTFLLKHNYRRGTIDKTLFIKKNSRDIILVQVYVDDIIFGSTNQTWCDEFEVLMKGEFEMSAMGELTFFLGLQVKQQPDGIFISQDKYVQDMLRRFDMESVRPATTPYEAAKPKSKDEPDDAVNVHLYRSMIGSLMYLTASRPDIMFAVSACSRHQVTPLTSNLNAVKKIFKYLKGQPKLGLWYPRDSPFVLEAYSDSDYAGSNGDRKSTTGGCQFLGRRLISWQCKKQTVVATSSTEAEYVAAAHCCGQVLWIENQLLDYGFNFMNSKIFIDNQSTICIVKNPVFHQRTKHIEIRHHFIRDANEKNLIQVLKIHTDDNVADLLTKAFDGPRFNYLVVHIGMLNP